MIDKKWKHAKLLVLLKGDSGCWMYTCICTCTHTHVFKCNKWNDSIIWLYPRYIVSKPENKRKCNKENLIHTMKGKKLKKKQRYNIVTDNVR